MRGLTIRTQMLVVFALIAVSQAVVAVIGLHGFQLSNNDLAEIYQERLVPVTRLARINDLMHTSIEQLTIAVISRPSRLPSFSHHPESIGKHGKLCEH